MSLSQPRQIFGVHSVAPYSRTDGKFYGIMKVLKSSSLNFTGTLVEVMGGSSKYAWAVEDGQIKAEMNLKVAQLQDFMFTLFFGKTPTAVGTDAAGTPSALTNVKGTSVFNGTTGIASVQVKASTGAADLKFGKYLIVCVTSTTVDVYASTDVDFTSKTNTLTFQNDLLKITASTLTVTTSSATTDIPNAGLQLVGGSGTIGMTVGDTASFTVNPPSSASISVVVGASGNVFPEFGAIIMGQKRSSLEVFEIDVYRCKAVGMPLGFDEFKFQEIDIKATCFYDQVKDAVFSVRHVSET